MYLVKACICFTYLSFIQNCTKLFMYALLEKIEVTLLFRNVLPTVQCKDCSKRAVKTIQNIYLNKSLQETEVQLYLPRKSTKTVFVVGCFLHLFLLWFFFFFCILSNFKFNLFLEWMLFIWDTFHSINSWLYCANCSCQFVLMFLFIIHSLPELN